jgi:hypothetical protein
VEEGKLTGDESYPRLAFLGKLSLKSFTPGFSTFQAFCIP